MLAALHNAPLCTTLRAEATVETDSAEQVALVRRRAQSSRQGRLIVMESGTTAGAVVTTSIAAFMDGVGRFRVEADGHVTIGDRTGTTTIRPDGTVTRSEERGPHRFQLLGLLLVPWPLAAILRIESVELGRIDGRDGWWVEAGVAEDPGSPVVMALEWWGERFRLGIDAATGVVLSLDGFAGDKTITRARWPMFEPDAPVDPGLFDAPDPTPTSIDERNEPPMRFTSAPNLSGFDGGEPPAEADRARQQIEAAYSHFNDVEDGSTALSHVVGGDILGPLLTDAKYRSPDTEIRLAVIEIVFRDPWDAAVLYQVELNGSLFGTPRQGAAYLVGEQWKVGYATVAHVIGLAGIDCPPPPDDPFQAYTLTR